MDPSTNVVEVDALRRVENVYRSRLAVEPTDMVARVSLAWCLFMQALHRAGQESVMGDAVPERGVRPLLDARSDDLLHDCLRQAITVTQLSQDPQDRMDIERLHALVKLSGGGQALSAAEKDARRILQEITREIMLTRGVERRRRRYDPNQSE